ncbi:MULTISPECIES: SoxR reducing system RseC family protein [Candidatus Ichthyocystis]|uniref:Putative positive regulator of sigma E activity n=1 Tax=Candidatus Ichthyocystis hellenicum TaxID=1561003 RepID=A0A0S4M1N1_9BURK|nr:MULTISPECIES: SoxR reducing system RseC family protein [Ichthyocystis]CUT17598.1 putative positive regulator of sigma E activity [Candidatus Ichthyocystis hellenicum]
MKKCAASQTTIFVRVVATEGNNIMVRHTNDAYLCSRCLSLGYCASQGIYSIFSGVFLPIFTIYSVDSCHIGDVLQVSVPRKVFLLGLLLIFFIPTISFLVVAVAAEFFHLREVWIFLLSCFSFLGSLAVVRFCLSRYHLDCVLSCKKIGFPNE